MCVFFSIREPVLDLWSECGCPYFHPICIQFRIRLRFEFRAGIKITILLGLKEKETTELRVKFGISQLWMDLMQG